MVNENNRPTLVIKTRAGRLRGTKFRGRQHFANSFFTSATIR
jgi:hypothetical protein